MTTTTDQAPAESGASEVALTDFTEYFVKNYPGPDTIICDPRWHAPRIFRAAKYAIEARRALDAQHGGGNLAQLRALAYVPGAWRCPKCAFRLVSSTLNARDGSMSANNEPQPCPNECGPMWRVTEREDRQDAQRFAIEQSEKLATVPPPSASVGDDRIVLWSRGVEPSYWFIAERSTRPNINGMPVYETLDPITNVPTAPAGDVSDAMVEAAIMEHARRGRFDSDDGVHDPFAQMRDAIAAALRTQDGSQ